MTEREALLREAERFSGRRLAPEHKMCLGVGLSARRRGHFYPLDTIFGWS
jgi:hypothetical protein